MPHPVAVAREAILAHNALQKGGELAAFLALLADVDPQVMVEVGSDAGGGLWAWRQVCPRVIGITLADGPFGSGISLDPHGCEILHGDSHQWSTYHRLARMLDGDRVDVLFVDGDHTFKGVKADYEMFGPLVRPGGIVAFHDICDHPRVPACKVRAFWESLDVDGKEEIVTEPRSWGGIGLIRVPALVAV